MSNPFPSGWNLLNIPMNPGHPSLFPGGTMNQPALRRGISGWRSLPFILCAGMIVWLAISPRPVAAQQNGSGSGQHAIRAEVDLVSVLASVLYDDGRPALDLTQDQFEVDEEGVKQKIAVFEPETTQPLDMTLMIDTSLSEVNELAFEGQAASRFVQEVVRPGDRMAIFEFSDTVTQLAPYSSNVPRLQAALKHLTPGAGTALYDAVYLGSQSLSRRESGRRHVIVLVTDAGETTSRADFETARRAAIRADALLYTIIVRAVRSENGRNTAGEHALETIADTTGGTTYFPDGLGQLDAMFSRINLELRTQYRLGYYPTPRPPAGSYRTIVVRAKCQCQVRYRKSYFFGGPVD